MHMVAVQPPSLCCVALQLVTCWDMPLNLSTQGVNGCWCWINSPPPTHHTHSYIPYRNTCERMRFISAILVPAVPLKVHISARVTWQVHFEAALHCDLIHFSFFLVPFFFCLLSYTPPFLLLPSFIYAHVLWGILASSSPALWLRSGMYFW